MAIRVVTSGTTTRVKKITRGPAGAATVVKRVTVGVPTKIGRATTGSIVTLDDVNSNNNLAEGSYLRYDSATSVFLHKNFDSDVKSLFSGGVGLTYDSASGSIRITNTGVDSGTYGSASQVPVFTVNAQGQIDSIGEVSVAGVTALTFDDSSGVIEINTADGQSFNATIGLASFTTDDLTEGSNLYYTDARATSAARQAISLDLDSDLFSYNNSTGVLTIYDSAIARTDREETFTKGIRIPDLEKITFCEGIADIFENGGNFFIRRTNTDLAGESGGNIYIMSRDSGTIHLQSFDGQRDLAHFRDHGGVELYWDNNLRFEILSDKIRLRDDVQVDDNLTVLGNLRVDGTTTTLNSTTLSVNDKNIVLADSATDSASTDGAGITVFYSGAAITYDHANATWDLNRPLGRDINVLSEHSTTDLSEGTNLYYTDARSRAAISVVDEVGSGLSYDSSTGVITYTGVTASDVRSYFSAAGDLSYDSTTGVFSFDVESVYTQANFDSDFNTSLDAAALDGVGLAYSSSTNTLSIDSAELSAYFSTDNITEGSTNLYFTESRVDSAIRDLTASKAFALLDSFSSSIMTVNYDTVNNKPAATFYAVPDSGQIIFLSDAFAIADQVGNVFVRTFSDSGQVVLYHNDNKKLRTTSTGVTITGTAVGDFDRSANTTVTAGTYGSASQVPVLTVDTSGFIDSIGSVSVAGVSSTSWNGSSSILTISTADGGSFTTNIDSFNDILIKSGTVNTTPTQSQASSDTVIVVDNTAHDSDFLSVEYTVHMDDSDAGHSQISKVLLTYNKSNVFFTEYGAISSFTNDSDIGTLTADVLGDNIRLKFQRATGMGTVNVKPTKTIIK
jgi:hypothetical protein